MLHGYRYWDFVSQELLEKARGFFPLSHAREDNFVAGLSMGGHGAFKLALQHARNVRGRRQPVGRGRRDASFANRARSTIELDLRQHRARARLRARPLSPGHVARRLSDAPRPRLYQCCGTEDFLLAQNRALRDHLQPLGFDYLYEEGPGLHDWVYWDKMIARTLSWLAARPVNPSRPGTGSGL